MDKPRSWMGVLDHMMFVVYYAENREKLPSTSITDEDVGIIAALAMAEVRRLNGWRWFVGVMSPGWGHGLLQCKPVTWVGSPVCSEKNSLQSWEETADSFKLEFYPQILGLFGCGAEFTTTPLHHYG